MLHLELLIIINNPFLFSFLIFIFEDYSIYILNSFWSAPLSATSCQSLSKLIVFQGPKVWPQFFQILVLKFSASILSLLAWRHSSRVSEGKIAWNMSTVEIELGNYEDHKDMKYILIFSAFPFHDKAKFYLWEASQAMRVRCTMHYDGKYWT